MRVSRSGYSAWLQRAQTTAEKEDAELTGIIHTVFKKSRATYGTRRLKKELVKQNRIISCRRISRLMREADLACTQGHK
jgi:hypothetical protein